MLIPPLRPQQVFYVKLRLDGAQLPKHKYTPVLGRNFVLGVLKLYLPLLDKVQPIKKSFYCDVPSVFCYSVTLGTW